MRPPRSRRCCSRSQVERGALQAAAELAPDEDLPDAFMHNWLLYGRGSPRLAQGRDQGGDRRSRGARAPRGELAGTQPGGLFAYRSPARARLARRGRARPGSRAGRARSSSWRAAGVLPARSAGRFAAWRSWRSRSPRSSSAAREPGRPARAPATGSSRPRRSWSWEPRSAAAALGPPRGSRCTRAWSSPTPAAPQPWSSGRGRSSWPPAPGRRRAHPHRSRRADPERAARGAAWRPTA